MSTHHLSTAALAALVVVAVLGGCGDEEQGSSSDVAAGADAANVVEQPATTPETTGAAAGADERCEALRELAAAHPPAGSLSPEEWKAAFDAYADAAERAAQVTPPAEATVLTDLAALMRLFADDPAAPDLAERVDELGSSALDLAAAAKRDCGVTFGI